MKTYYCLQRPMRWLTTLLHYVLDLHCCAVHDITTPAPMIDTLQLSSLAPRISRAVVRSEVRVAANAKAIRKLEASKSCCMFGSSRQDSIQLPFTREVLSCQVHAKSSLPLELFRICQRCIHLHSHSHCHCLENM